jgi:hypothetical protein
MARKRRSSRQEEQERSALALGGTRLLEPLRRSLEIIHSVGTERDKAGQREFFMDHYVVLLLLYFFNPSLTSLRALQQASNWDKIQKKFGIRRVSLGSLSESARVFDPAFVRPLIKELAAQATPHLPHDQAAALADLTAVDGTFFAALPRMAWALWQDAEHRGVKAHVQFDVATSVPRDVAVTPAACSEPATLAGMLEPGRLYVCDRGYESFALMRGILDAGSSLIIRVKDDIALHVQEERAVSPEAARVGVVRDVLLRRLGSAKHKDVIGRPMRLVVVHTTNRDGKSVELWLITDRLDMAADLVAIAYRYRWSVELFFRWLKCILGARHLVSQKEQGVTLQIYAALIVSLLIAVRTGRKPTKRTFETIQFYLLGWVTDQEFADHLANLKNATT